jgi:Xaa-Pro aminopeptidase
MSFCSTFPKSEIHTRLERLKNLLATLCPTAEGLMLFSRLNIYYCTGTLANGIFWLPREGEPLLFVRKGIERAALESPHIASVAFRSYSELLPAISKTSPVSRIAAEKNTLPWHLGEMLQQKCQDVTFVSGEGVINTARAIKTDYELTRMRLAGERHRASMCDLFPARMASGMSELDLSHLLLDIMLKLGHGGLSRLNAFGEEVFLGHLCVGENGAYPSYYNGPLGVLGQHPANPFAGSAGHIWQKNMVVSADIGFFLEGYQTDKTQVYFSGKAADIPAAARKAHDFCLRIEEDTAKALVPGAIPSALYAQAREQAVRAGYATTFMGHGGNQVPFLGHGIGLAIDEPPVLARRFDKPLEAGMTLAIEPKITVPGVGMVGSENTYLVAEGGAEPLTGPPLPIICVDR